MNNVLSVLSVGEAAWALLGRLGVDLFFTALTVRAVVEMANRVIRRYGHPAPALTTAAGDPWWQPPDLHGVATDRRERRSSENRQASPAVTSGTKGGKQTAV